jgi:putative nucleotidyltransferase with HDIG domain
MKHHAFYRLLPIIKTIQINIPGTKPIWEHTLKVCDSVRIDRILRWAALFHDMGKPLAYNTGKSPVFPMHADIGARIWLETAKDISFPPKEADSVWRLIKYHMHVQEFSDKWKNKAIKKLIKQYDGVFDSAIELAIADGMDLEKALTLFERGKKWM